MLPRARRLTSTEDFATVVRRGRRCSRRHLVVHHWQSGRAQPAEVGFVVSRAVGGAVERNLVKRRLRHIARETAERLPAGELVVVRALPSAAQVPYWLLEAEMVECLSGLADGAR